MPQLFQVLRCYKCLIFQIHQTKKSNKWQCKLCGEKQSIKRHYGIGTSKDCRMHVQKLNKMQGEKNYTSQHVEDSLDSSSFEDESFDVGQNTEQETTKTNSKWSQYVDENDEITPVFLDSGKIKTDNDNHCFDYKSNENENNITDSYANEFSNYTTDGVNNKPTKMKKFDSFGTNRYLSKKTKINNNDHNCIHTDSDNKIFPLGYQGTTNKTSTDTEIKKSKWTEFLENDIENDSVHNNNVATFKISKSNFSNKEILNPSPDAAHANTSLVKIEPVQNSRKWKHSLLGDTSENIKKPIINVENKNSFFSFTKEQELDSILDI